MATSMLTTVASSRTKIAENSKFDYFHSNLSIDEDDDDEVFVENHHQDFYNFSKLKQLYEETRLKSSFPSTSGAFRQRSASFEDTDGGGPSCPGAPGSSNFIPRTADCSTKNANFLHASTTRLVEQNEMQRYTTNYRRDMPTRKTRLVFEGTLFYKTTLRRQQQQQQQQNGVSFDGKKAWSRDQDRNCWKQCWAVLRENHVLYLFKERPVNVPYELDPLPDKRDDSRDENRETVNVDSCIADVAYEYCKVYKSCTVFRIITQTQTEHLFKTENTCDMLKWLENLQRSNNLENNPNGLTNSMALIIKRYEAHSITVSPSTSKSSKKSGFFTKNSSSNGKSKENCSTVTTLSNGYGFNEIHPNGVTAKQSSSSSSSVEKQTESTTPVVKQKKWRKIRKHGSCPSESSATPPSIPPQSPLVGGLPNPNLNPDAVFGQPLERCPTGDNDFVPLIVQLCVKVVERHGLKVVGVYRIPGNTANVNSLIASLDKGFENADFNDQRWKDVNVVSSLVKAYFRKLPDSLLTDKLYQQFIDANRIDNHFSRLKLMRCLIEKLPKANYETLRYLMMHLKKVVSYSHVNKMQARNLALMFGPSLLRMNNDSMATMVYHMSDQCQIVESLILYCDWLFCSSDLTGDLLMSIPPPPVENLLKSEQQRSNGAISTSELLNNSLTKDLHTTKEDDSKTCNGHATAHDAQLFFSPIIRSTISPLISSYPPPLATNNVVGGLHFDSSSTSAYCSSSTASYNERNIDDEIENRRKVCENLIAMETQNSINRSAGGNSSIKKDRQVRGGLDLTKMVDEIRRRRQEHISNARRNFITGSGDNNGVAAVPLSDESIDKMDCLLKHSRHIDVNPNSLDVFTPETRDKIRRFQNDNRQLIRRNRNNNGPPSDNASMTSSDYSTASSLPGVAPPGGETSPAHRKNGYTKFGGRKSDTVMSSLSNANLTAEYQPWYRQPDDDVVEVGKCSTEILDYNGNTSSSNMQILKCRPKQCRSQSVSGRQPIDNPPVYRSDSVQLYNNNEDDMQISSPNLDRQVQQSRSKRSKAEKLKVWFKESFRRSSPDLTATTDTAEDDEGLVTKV